MRARSSRAAEFQPRRRSRLAGWAAASVAGLLLGATLAPFHPGRQESVPWFCVACTPEGGADLVANVVAFVPLGVLLVRAGWSPARATLAGALLSAAIELLQATGIEGRTATLGDVIANTAGAAVGAALAAVAGALWRPTPGLARALAGGTAAAWVALMGASTWLQGRDPLRGPVPPRPGALPSVPHMGWYHGRVLAARVDGWTPPLPAAGPLVVATPVGRVAALGMTVAGGDARGVFVPAMAVLDAAFEPAVVVGQRDEAAEVRVRTRAHAWRLREAPLLACGALAHLVEGGAARAHIAVRLAPDQVTLRVSSTPVVAQGAQGAAVAQTAVHTAERRVTPEHGWMVVTPFARPWGPETLLLDLLWTCAPLVPLGFWLGCGAGRRVGRWAAPAAGAVVLLLGLGVGPRLAGGRAAGWPAVAAAAMALALGAWYARTRLPPPTGPASLRG